MLRTPAFAIFILTGSALAAQVPSAQVASAGTAAAAAAKGTAKAAPQKSDLDRVVCKEQDTIGTRLGAKKVCMTVAQWDEFNRDEQEQTQHIQQNLGIVSH